MDGASDPTLAVATDPMIAPTVRVRVVGACEITIGRTKVRPDSAVLFALLLYLTARAGERVARADILDFLWPGQPDAPRRHSLRQIVYRIRRAGLECDVDGADLTIDIERVDSDINRIRTDAWIAESPMAELPARGAILSGCNSTVSPAFGEWVESLRGEANSCVRRAALRHIAKARREGRWSDLDSMARLCLSSDPLNEEATLALAEATAMTGSKAEALRILDAYVWEIGDKAKEIGLPAKLLRRRISDQPQSRVPRVGESPLVGRSEELAWLNDRLESTETGEPRAVLLVGPPGIGKSALAKAFGAQAEMRGWRMFEARLQPSDTSRPMSLFVELLPGLLKAEGAIGASPESIALIRQLLQHDDSEETMAERVREGPAFPARLGAAILDLVNAVGDEGPIILLLDDLHWIDAHSLRALARITESMVGRPVFFLLSTRTEGQFGTVRETLHDDRVSLRVVPPLATSAVAEMLVALAPEATHLSSPEELTSALTLTGGNPLFIRGLAAHWRESGSTGVLPADLRQFMRTRVARLSPSALRVLHACAMLGRYATVARLTQMLEASTSELLAAIEELDELGVLGLKDEPGSLALHDLWAEELLAGIRAPTRALLHLRCGEILEAEALESRVAGIVHDAARHLSAAGCTERALQLLMNAAAHQLQNGFADAAVQISARALDGAAESPERAAILLFHLQALAAVGDWARIAELNPALSTSVQSLAVGSRHNHEELLVLEALWRTGTAPSAAMTSALRCAEDSGAPTTHRTQACQLAARIASNLFDSEVLSRVQEVLRSLASQPASDDRMTLSAHCVVETEFGDLTKAAGYAERLIQLERAQGSILGLSTALRYATYPLRAVGEAGRALTCASEAHEIASRHQLIEEAAISADICASIALSSRDWSTAEEWLRKFESWRSRTSVSYLIGERNLARTLLAIALGDAHTAQSLFSERPPLESRTSLRQLLGALEVELGIARLLGDADRLVRAVESAKPLLERTRTWIRHDDVVSAFIEGLTALGRSQEAAKYARAYISEWRRDTGPIPERLVLAAESRHPGRATNL
jgi:predicted ATPase/DNA-binding SARP family transcriptional activator